MIKNKFRALKDDMSNCNFVYGNLIYDTDGLTPRIQIGNSFSFSTCIKGTEGIETGVLDNLGKSIFEGDILKGIHGNYIVGDFLDFNYLVWKEPHWFNHVIIGNIHQNPELCK